MLRVARRRLAGGADNRGIADRREAGSGSGPGSRDDAPMLGAGGIDRLVVATGHHRNGILLTPAQRGGGQCLYIDRHAARNRPSVFARAFCRVPASPQRQAAAETAAQ